MRLSVIIPLAPGETEHPALLHQLECLLSPADEIILVAAHDPIAWTSRIAVQSLATAPGRAGQLNHAAAQATGRHLWFLHADTRLSHEAFPALLRFIEADRMSIGWFHLAFRTDGPALTHLNAIGANLRSRLGMPFGDQGFVLPARLFSELGGFDTQAPYGEDHLLIWAARRAGHPIRPVGATISTSARKYARLGWALTTARHIRLTLAQAWPQFLAWRLKP